MSVDRTAIRFYRSVCIVALVLLVLATSLLVRLHRQHQYTLTEGPNWEWKKGGANIIAYDAATGERVENLRCSVDGTGSWGAPISVYCIENLLVNSVEGKQTWQLSWIATRPFTGFITAEGYETNTITFASDSLSFLVTVYLRRLQAGDHDHVASARMTNEREAEQDESTVPAKAAPSASSTVR